MMFLDSDSPPQAYIDSPHGHLARWRKVAPMQHIAQSNLWIATSYDWVSQLLRDDRLILTKGGSFAERSREFRVTVVKYLRAFFGAPDDPYLDNVVREVVHETVGRMVKAEKSEMVGEVARAIPCAVMGRLLGIPDAELRQIWPLTAVLFGQYDIPKQATTPSLAKVIADAYFKRHLLRARKHGVSPLMTLLVESSLEHGIADEVLIDVCSRLLAAGTSTTGGVIGNILIRLLLAPTDTFPEQPAPQYLEAIVEELLRLETPVLGVKRRAKCDLDLPGAAIKKGQKVLLMVAAANRDPLHFPNPDVIDLERRKPKHLSFGVGAFHCLGAPLARKELSILLNQLLPLLHAIEVQRAPTHNGGWLLHEPGELHVNLRNCKSC